MKIFVGIIDDLGLDNFFECNGDEEEKMGIVKLRARLNPQRHPKVFRIELIRKESNKISKLMTELEYKDAAKLLKVYIDLSKKRHADKLIFEEVKK